MNSTSLISSFTPADSGYPTNLLGGRDRPKELWIRGEVLPQDQRAIAIVGSRACSRNGVLRTVRLARELVGCGFTIVSGLAKGIDAAAHRTALDADGRTLAVVGTGLHTVYPAENRDLHDRILDQGAVLSQFPPSFGGFPGGRHFLMRNVTLVTMSLGTVVVEAGQRSGSRHAANSAIAQGRPLFLLRSLVDAQSWATQMAALPRVHVVDRVEDITERLQDLAAIPQRRLLQEKKKGAAEPHLCAGVA